MVYQHHQTVHYQLKSKDKPRSCIIDLTYAKASLFTSKARFLLTKINK